MLKGDTFKSITDFALGGQGGNGGDGGDVTVINEGNIVSTASDSYGIFAQSLGGGGGKAAYSLSSPAYTAVGLLHTTLIGGGKDGDHGSVDIQQNGNINLTGNNSQAFFAQEIAGGGGNATNYLDVSKQAIKQGNGSVISTANPVLASTDRLIGTGLDIVQVCKINNDKVQDMVGDYCKESHLNPPKDIDVTAVEPSFNHIPLSLKSANNGSFTTKVNTLPLKSATNGSFTTKGVNQAPIIYNQLAEVVATHLIR